MKDIVEAKEAVFPESTYSAQRSRPTISLPIPMSAIYKGRPAKYQVSSQAQREALVKLVHAQGESIKVVLFAIIS